MIEKKIERERVRKREKDRKRKREKKTNGEFSDGRPARTLDTIQ